MEEKTGRKREVIRLERNRRDTGKKNKKKKREIR